MSDPAEPSRSPSGGSVAPSGPAPARVPDAPFYGPVGRYGRPPAEHAGPGSAVPARPLPPGPPPGGHRSTGAQPGPPPGPAVPWIPSAAPVPGPWGPPPPPSGPGPWAPPRRDDYASWSRRVAAAAIDSLPGWIASAVLVAGYLPTYAGFFRGDLTVPPRSWLVLVGTLLSLAAFGLAVWNVYVRAGRTGQSYGKRLLGIWLVGRRTGRPIGPLDAFVRSLLHTLDRLGYVGYLWPLWDDERQTLADKIADTVVVRTPVAPLTDRERRQG